MEYKRIKRIPSHSGHARYLAGVQFGVREIARTNIPSPYASGPSHLVHRDDTGREVFVVETAHKQYDVFEVPANTPTFVNPYDCTCDAPLTQEYELFDSETDESHGKYATLDEARGASQFDRLKEYTIWCGNTRVEEGQN